MNHINEHIIQSLNKAFIDEWIAYYQYWIGAKLATGPSKEKAIGEFLEHANDERRHADAILTLILQLDGTPITAPDEWSDLSNCKYENPTDPSSVTLVKQNIKAEECAISSYAKLIDEIDDPDIISVLKSILKDELKHKKDLMNIIDNIPISKRNFFDPPISKRAQDPVQRTAESILKIINFILFRVPQKDKTRYLQRIRGKILRIQPGQVGSKKMPQTASIGQAISLTKNILAGLNPFFIKQVIDELSKMMILQIPSHRTLPPRPVGV